MVISSLSVYLFAVRGARGELSESSLSEESLLEELVIEFEELRELVELLVSE